MKPIPKTKGFFYIRTRKSKSGPVKWYLWYETSENGERVYNRVPELAYSEVGFKASMTAEQAKARCKRVNKERALKKDEIRTRLNAAKNLLTIESLDDVLFPQEYVSAFQTLLDDENFGTDYHLKRLYSHFNFVQKMMISLRLTPENYKEESKRVYKYFIKKKTSNDYSNKLLNLANRWGAFVSKTQGQYFEPIPVPRGRSRSAIADAQRTKKGKNSELGVRTASEPLTPMLLKIFKDSFTIPEHWNFLFISLWFGLRPYEIDMLKDKKKWKLGRDNKTGIIILSVYQTKLMGVEESKRYKYIPVLFKEQHLALRMIKEGSYKRPHSKTVKKHLESNTTLYGGRKGFTDLMLEKGQKLEDISMWLGHKDISTTWKHYKNKDKVSFVKTKEVKFS